MEQLLATVNAVNISSSSSTGLPNKRGNDSEERANGGASMEGQRCGALAAALREVCLPS
jgi:hypothetical protein